MLLCEMLEYISDSFQHVHLVAKMPENRDMNMIAHFIENHKIMKMSGNIQICDELVFCKRITNLSIIEQFLCVCVLC